jgi:exoribonuclease-2
MKDGLVRVDTLPLVLRALGAESLPRGTHVRIRITGTDLLTLDVHANVVARLDDQAAAADESTADDTDEGAADSAGPLTLAIDIQADDAEASDRAEPAESTAPST